MSTFGKVFKITTFGESHCAAVGVIIDGCPSNMKLKEIDIQLQLNRRRPGQSSISTPRDEKDKVKILSGTEKGVTLGTPIAARVYNLDFRPTDYDFIGKKDYVPRPSHADFTYYCKYGIHASSGGGRSSARETIGRVIGGTVAEKWLKENLNIEIVAFVNSVGIINSEIKENEYKNITREMVDKSIVRCPNLEVANKMEMFIKEIKNRGDSVGGVVTCICKNVPAGLGEPCFDKLEALLAHAMMSIPATKGFEIGKGFKCTKMFGSKHNDPFFYKDDKIQTMTNNSGGIQGGISNGEDIYFNVAFKPPSTIMLHQASVTMSGIRTIIKPKGRHDPCVVNRAVPIVESMAALVLMDCFMIQKTRI